MSDAGGTEGERQLFDRCALLMHALGFCRSDEVREVTRLTGGVASDIAIVRFRDRSMCAKFALPKLKVAADWQAPVRRGKAEYAWLSVAAGVLVGSAPQVFGWSEDLGGFAMEHIHGPDVYLWKSALLAGEPDRGEAQQVAGALGAIHAASALPSFDRSPFRNAEDFDALRLDPYLRFTSRIHPEVGGRMCKVADRLLSAAYILVHGDVSPKNILFRGETPIILDAECATMGDPCFDVAFCLNHLVLKAIHLPYSRGRLLANVLQFWDAYRQHVVWEDPGGLGARVAELLPMLMLARVDGKSPVEYLTPDERRLVRALSLPLIERPLAGLAEFVAAIKAGVPT